MKQNCSFVALPKRDPIQHLMMSMSASLMASNDDIWEQRFQEMVAYQQKHGNLHLHRKSHREYQSLGWWVTRQRNQHAKNRLPQNRVDKLDSVNFPWKAESYNDMAWRKVYSKLVQEFESNGHLEFTADMTKWAKRHRALYREGILSQDKIDLLNKINFVWYPRKKSIKTVEDSEDDSEDDVAAKRWKVKFRQLLGHKKKFGHCLVDEAYDRKLNKWVRCQRHYGSRGLLQKARKEMLDTIGFEWKDQKSKKPSEKELRWDEMYNQLKVFIDQTGHSRVPQHGNTHRLYLWVNRIVASGCTNRPDRKARLDKIGFSWERPIPHHSIIQPGCAKTTVNNSEQVKFDHEHRRPYFTRSARKRLCQEQATRTNDSGQKLGSTDIAVVMISDDTDGSISAVKRIQGPEQTLEQPVKDLPTSTMKPSVGLLTTRVLQSSTEELANQSPKGPDKIKIPFQKEDKDEPLRVDPSVDIDENSQLYPVGTPIVNFFPDHGWRRGVIQTINNGFYTVVYEGKSQHAYSVEGTSIHTFVELEKSRQYIADTATDLCMLRKGFSEPYLNEDEVSSSTEAMGRNEALIEVSDAADITNNLKSKISELETSLQGSHYALTVARSQLEVTKNLLWREQSRCRKKEVLVNDLTKRLEDLEQRQFLSGSIGQKVLLTLKEKMKL